EELIKAAYNLDHGIIETIAHYISAKRINPDVTFILDIGGQDMKAIFIENGVLTRMEINEACSSGCGTFIETFAKSLNRTVPEFAEMACMAKHPSDLGTRCTVFMNSKVKQVLREGASIDDIAAGLSYSVIKNCLFKVLKFKNVSELGAHIVVQGGTMKNDSVVRALEKLVNQNVYRSNNPELMGALGCALYAKEHTQEENLKSTFLNIAEYTTKQIRCHGCENQCYVNKYTFANNNIFFSGNKCEKIFTNRGESTIQGRNAYTTKYELLFDRKSSITNGITIGIPRSLNMYEDYPFWHTLFEECGIRTLLSEPSSYTKYEQGVHSVMSDNICFPAKLLHSHIYELIEKGVDRIFYPFVIYEKAEGEPTSNTYNCPVVTGYSEIIKSAIVPDIPVDNPVISFKDKTALEKQCVSYMRTLGVSASTTKKAVKKALEKQHDYEVSMFQLDKEILEDGIRNNRLTILLAGRPYHTDPLVQHKVSDMVASMGINVITEDIVRFDEKVNVDETYIVSQWAYINRILKASKWVAAQGNNVHYIQMTSFGCGPDAFLLDEVKGVLNRSGKALTILKIDDINNIGSLKLRVRSVAESIKYNNANETRKKEFHATKIFEKEDRPRKIIAPFFTDYVSPVMSSCFKLAGYDLEVLPESDQESAETGLIYTNNEVCYPAILVVGDLIKALQSGKYDINNTAVAMSQTGGQCRATNYLALIKKAMVEAGFEDVPVISFAIGDGLINKQPGFSINWAKMIPIALAGILYTDTISKFYHASVVREKEKGLAVQLRQKYLDKANELILANKISDLYPLLGEAAEDYNSILKPGLSFPKVGIVGEIYLKFNGFAHKRVTQWFIDHQFEVVPPQLLDFFTQSFVNRKVRNDNDFKKAPLYDMLFNVGYKLIQNQIKKVDNIASKFKYYTPFNDIFDEAEHGKEILSLSVQFGEGWLLPAEIVSFAKSGVNNVVSLQPFGCIANHIISRGMEKKIKTLFPKMNLLSLDFDSGVSETNVVNRLLLFSNNIK
ncbi:MAG: 2-hydroxyacyl-CoA dehydratase, partial [Bacteroidales bacterium]|nr:2-hydroxyacyl-CoA dehydratase [Bacteroidales bacterium]